MLRSFWQLLSGCEKVVRSFQKVVTTFFWRGGSWEQRNCGGEQRQNRCLRGRGVKGGEGNGGCEVGDDGQGEPTEAF